MQNFIQEITREAGFILKDKFKKIGILRTKQNPADILTEADLAANEFLLEKIKAEYPDHGIISEELPEVKSDSGYVWTIDPLDGTSNFAREIPLFASMVSLMKDDDVILGCIYDPIHDEMFFAAKGEGAFLNGEKIKCAEKDSLEYTFGVFDACYKAEIDSTVITGANRKKAKNSRYNSAGLSSVFTACGRRDWAILAGAYLWDYAPSSIILREAGCKVTNLAGEEWTIKDRDMIASNPNIHQELIEMLNG